MPERTEMGISTDVLVAACTPDVQATALGSGAVADFAPHLYDRRRGRV